MTKEEIKLPEKLEKIKKDLLANGITTEAFEINYEYSVHPEYEINFMSTIDKSGCVGVSVYDNEFYIMPQKYIIYWTPGILQLIAKFIKYFYKSIAKLKIYYARAKKDAATKKLKTTNNYKSKCIIKGNNNRIINK